MQLEIFLQLVSFQTKDFILKNKETLSFAPPVYLKSPCSRGSYEISSKLEYN